MRRVIETRAELLDESHQADYEHLLNGAPQRMVSHSWSFRSVFLDLLKAESAYIGAFEGGRLVAAIPAVIKKGPSFSVVNSLPLSGSQGGCLTDRSLTESGRAEARMALLSKFSETAELEGCLTSTIITSPFDTEQSYYEKLLPADYTEGRVAQVLDLPPTPEGLDLLFNKKCRNAIRRAEKKGVRAEVDTTSASMDLLTRAHAEQMEKAGALPKPTELFDTISRTLERDREYKIYKATVNGEVGALLLAIYEGDTVDYFTPATFAEFRSFSPMNVIVKQLAEDAIKDGFRRLNFGGTRKDQADLYRFKNSFGCTDQPYHYRVNRVRRRGSEPLEVPTRSDLERDFQYFYVYPFDLLSELGRA